MYLCEIRHTRPCCVCVCACLCMSAQHEIHSAKQRQNPESAVPWLLGAVCSAPASAQANDRAASSSLMASRMSVPGKGPGFCDLLFASAIRLFSCFHKLVPCTDDHATGHNAALGAHFFLMQGTRYAAQHTFAVYGIARCSNHTLCARCGQRLSMSRGAFTKGQSFT